MYTDKLDDIVNKYSNTSSTIKMKPADITSSTYIDVNKEDLNFKIGNHVRIMKCKNIFAKGYTPNWSEETFVIKKVKNTVPWMYVISDHNGKEIFGTFYEKELQNKQI